MSVLHRTCCLCHPPGFGHQGMRPTPADTGSSSSGRTHIITHPPNHIRSHMVSGLCEKSYAGNNMPGELRHGQASRPVRQGLSTSRLLTAPSDSAAERFSPECPHSGLHSRRLLGLFIPVFWTQCWNVSCGLEAERKWVCSEIGTRISRNKQSRST